MICIVIISQKIAILYISEKTLSRFFAVKAYYYGTGCRIKSGTDGFSPSTFALQD